MKKKEKIKNTTSRDVAANKKTSNKTGLMLKYIIGIVSYFCVIAILYKGGLQIRPVPSVGEIANEEIRAQIDFSYIDKQATDALLFQAIASVPPIYSIDLQVKQNALKRVDDLFYSISSGDSEEMIKQKNTWLNDDMVLKSLLQTTNIDQVKQNLIKLINEILDKGIITSATRIKIISSGKDIVQLKNPETNTSAEVNIDKFITDDDLDNFVVVRLKTIHPFDRLMRQVMQEILLNILAPNIVYDSTEVKRLKEAAKQLVNPIYKNYRKGQTIVRRGDPITETVSMIFKAHADELSKNIPKFRQWWNAVGTALLVGIFFFILITYIRYHQPDIFSCNKKLFLLSIIIVSTLALTRLISYIPINPDKPFWQYFMVIPVGAILIAILMDKELSILSSMIMGIIATMIFERSVPYAAVVLFVSIVGIQTSAKLLHRWEFIRAGILLGIAYIAAIIMMNLLKMYSLDVFLWGVILYQLIGGFCTGIICSVAVIIFLPIIERAFDITTDMRLLELTDLNHPLLKTMITEAPGTYHHSIVVSNMAEDAAAAIGANPLLAKVGGYFHDIGKVTKPEYFVENVWFEEKSRHEKLLPTMSNLVITAHVKDGGQLAKKYKLPKVILDIINEHHGTSVVYYFYKQAEMASAQNGTEVSEVDFRYPGPKPQSKESAIILLADAIEAASHTLIKPTPNRIIDLVKEISGDKLNDGQLDECGLTLKDINIIRERFSHILTGILHKRVEYPEINGKHEDKSK